jgi:sulfur-oxidizing protein SoxY
MMRKLDTKPNISKIAQLSCAAIVAIAFSTATLKINNSIAAETDIKSSNLSSLPKDSLNSVMWDFVATEFLLSDKSSKKIVMNNQILVHAPKVAEDQLNLPIHVDARSVKNVQKIVVIADLNPIPKVLTYEPKQAEARLSFRIKVGQATPVRAAVLDKDGVWHVGGTFVDASGGGCSQPAVAYGNDDWVKRLAEIRGKIWRTPGQKSAKLRFSVRHPMDTGLADGIPAFFVEKLEFKGANNKLIGNLIIHEPISENPTETLFPILKEATTAVQIKGRDNDGNLIDVAVPAPVQSSALQN